MSDTKRPELDLDQMRRDDVISPVAARKVQIAIRALEGEIADLRVALEDERDTSARLAATVRDLLQYAPGPTSEEIQRCIYDDVPPATTLSATDEEPTHD